MVLKLKLSWTHLISAGTVPSFNSSFLTDFYFIPIIRLQARTSKKVNIFSEGKKLHKLLLVFV